jgi:prepilin-type processing-associated H-X9-DG protein
VKGVFGTNPLSVAGAWLRGDVSHENEFENYRQPASLREVTDGRAQTILLAEHSGHPTYHTRAGIAPQQPFPVIGAWFCFDWHWINPPFAVNEANYGGPFAFHPGGAQVAMCDGSVHFLSEGISAQTLVALVSRAGGEPVDPKDWAR